MIGDLFINAKRIKELNHMKDKLSRREPCLGVSVMYFCPQIVEIIGYLGFDWVLLDCEHGSLGESEIEQMAIAGRAAGLSVIARPQTNRPSDISTVMDKGVDGVQIPHITSLQDAKRAVDAVKFHPFGKRSLAIGTRSSRYGINHKLDDYVSESNSRSIVILQIEDKEAIDNLESILGTPYVDVFFVGPSDLSQSLGYPGKASEPPVKDTIDHILSEIQEKGLTSGIAGNFTSLKDWREQGVSYLYTHLNTIIERGVNGFL